MSITHVGAASVFVSDLDRALDYYTRVLGLTLRKDTGSGGPGPRTLWIGFPEGRAILVLVEARAMGPAARMGGFTGIILDADDAQRSYEELKERGATFVRPITNLPHGWQAILSDPDGNEFILYQPHDEADRH